MVYSSIEVVVSFHLLIYGNILVSLVHLYLCYVWWLLSWIW